MRCSARSKWTRVTLSLSLALAMGSVAPQLAAQDAKELARARVAFQQAIELEQAGNHSAAVRMFREVGQVRMTPQVRFHIALCEDKLGKLVAALGGYELALAEADSVGPEFRAEVEENVNRLRARIPKLVIRRGEGAEAAAIELDSEALGDSSVGVEVPLDPGPHAITAHAPGHHPFEATVTLAPGETKSLELVLEALPAPEASVSRDAGASNVLPAQKRPKLLPYVVGGVGAASLVASGVFLAFRQTTASDLDEACKGGLCPKSKEDDYSRLKTYHYGSLVTFGVGVAAVGTATVLLVLDARQSRKEASGWSFTPKVTPRYAGGTAELRF
jgi:hypothetical protein